MAVRPGFSDDLRWLVIYHRSSGKKFQEILQNIVPVSVATQRRWWHYYMHLRDVRRVRNNRARPPKMSAVEDRYVVQLLQEDRTQFVRELAVRMEDRFGHPFSSSAIHRSLQRSNITHKKLDQRALQAQLLDQLRFLNQIYNVDPSRIIAFDESGSDRRNLHRNFGWSVKGLRAQHRSFWSRGRRYGVLAAISLTGVVASWTQDSSMNAESYAFFVSEVLIPYFALWYCEPCCCS